MVTKESKSKDGLSKRATSPLRQSAEEGVIVHRTGTQYLYEDAYQYEARVK